MFRDEVKLRSKHAPNMLHGEHTNANYLLSSIHERVVVVALLWIVGFFGVLSVYARLAVFSTQRDHFL